MVTIKIKLILKVKLSSSRLYLRNLYQQDATINYLYWLSDPTINKYLDVRLNPPQLISDLEDFILSSNRDSNTLLLGIFLKKTHKHIGNIKINYIDWIESKGDIGFLIGDESEWGKGYASEAIALILNYLFKELNFKKVTAGCNFKNLNSIKILKKNLFLEIGKRPLTEVLDDDPDQKYGLLFQRLNPNII